MKRGIVLLFLVWSLYACGQKTVHLPEVRVEGSYAKQKTELFYSSSKKFFGKFCLGNNVEVASFVPNTLSKEVFLSSIEVQAKKLNVKTQVLISFYACDSGNKIGSLIGEKYEFEIEKNTHTIIFHWKNNEIPIPIQGFFIGIKIINNPTEKICFATAKNGTFFYSKNDVSNEWLKDTDRGGDYEIPQISLKLKCYKN